MELTTALKALADDNRLLILRLLGRRDYCVRQRLSHSPLREILGGQ